MEKITILTISPEDHFLKRIYLWFKEYIKKIFLNYGGPQVVLESLIRGLIILNIDYQLNPKINNISGIVCVIQNVNALKWAIKAKRQGKIKKIIAGPNITITPEDANSILLNKEIDLIIVPSQWVKDFYISLNPEISKKIRIWPAGVEFCPESKQKRRGCLIYKKSINKDIFNFIVRYLKSKNVDYKIIKYGKYRKEKYFKMLNKAEFMIYLSESESQGIALQEAWIRDVPTLVWNRGYWQYKQYKWSKSSSAPYLNDSCGMLFKDKDDFRDKYYLFINNLSNFGAREYSLENFTDKTTSKRYLEIISELIENYGK